MNRSQCNCAGGRKKRKRKEGEPAEVEAKQERGVPPRGRRSKGKNVVGLFWHTMHQSQQERNRRHATVYHFPTETATDAGIAHPRRQQGRRGAVRQVLKTLLAGRTRSLHPGLRETHRGGRVDRETHPQQRDDRRPAHVLAPRLKEAGLFRPKPGLRRGGDPQARLEQRPPRQDLQPFHARLRESVCHEKELHLRAEGAPRDPARLPHPQLQRRLPPHRPLPPLSPKSSLIHAHPMSPPRPARIYRHSTDSRCVGEEKKGPRGIGGLGWREWDYWAGGITRTLKRKVGSVEWAAISAEERPAS